MPPTRDLFSPAFWRQYMLQTFLQHWRKHALDKEHGGYIADLDRAWHISGPCHKSLVSQGRLIYNFSAGLRHAGQGDYADAAAWGVQFLKQRMADAEHGGWYWRVHRDGSVLEPVKHTYGHAFVILGLSEFARATKTLSAADLPLATLRTLRDKAARPDDAPRRLPDAGNPDFPCLWALMDRQWQPLQHRPSQNPHMHLLEACMSLFDVTGDRLAMDSALGLAELVTANFINTRHGPLEECLAEDWSFLPDDNDEPIRIGHQFEWGWLLHRLADRSGQDSWRILADRLIEWGLTHGADRQHGGFYNGCDRQGAPVDTSKSHWTQTEALRALLYLVARRGRQDLRETFTRAAGFALTHLADPQYGGWYSSVNADGTPDNPAKGSEWKLDYHMVSLCDEAVRVLG